MSKMSKLSLKEKYHQEIAPRLVKELGLGNLLAAPKILKVVVNIGVGEGSDDKGAINEPIEVLSKITGQKPKIALARRSEAGFRLREGAPIGLVVNLRAERMYSFLEKLFNVAMPRLRDFQGASVKSFDGKGNYTLGIPEYTIFPETDEMKVEKAKGLEVTFVTSVNDDLLAKRLLELMGMPFEKKEN